MGHYDDVRERLEIEELESSLQGLTLREAYYKGLNKFRGKGWHDTPTLRDKFAMAAISGMAVNSHLCYEDLSKFAYDLADEMMKARERNIK